MNITTRSKEQPTAVQATLGLAWAWSIAFGVSILVAILGASHRGSALIIFWSIASLAFILKAVLVSPAVSSVWRVDTKPRDILIIVLISVLSLQLGRVYVLATEFTGRAPLFGAIAVGFVLAHVRADRLFGYASMIGVLVAPLTARLSSLSRYAVVAGSVTIVLAIGALVMAGRDREEGMPT